MALTRHGSCRSAGSFASSSSSLCTRGAHRRSDTRSRDLCTVHGPGGDRDGVSLFAIVFFFGADGGHTGTHQESDVDHRHLRLGWLIQGSRCENVLPCVRMGSSPSIQRPRLRARNRCAASSWSSSLQRRTFVFAFRVTRPAASWTLGSVPVFPGRSSSGDFAGGRLIIALRARVALRTGHRVLRGSSIVHAQGAVLAVQYILQHPEETTADRPRNWSRESISQSLRRCGCSRLREVPNGAPGYGLTTCERTTHESPAIHGAELFQRSWKGDRTRHWGPCEQDVRRFRAERPRWHPLLARACGL
ncbi:hypothetical protein L226DRAFT_236552 [Lentinus tigrinus ALCF2SS1-7]|uniref:uncharacterized protein n=1 Tax=Lentinus tigrinus ALCF2SS1-7 TaxID=1328758 RepID=UPI001165EA9C|nr:hypothetical protein L226DRAFT_236552 [Lentinus tigrinus ALCF2SS1-7]